MNGLPAIWFVLGPAALALIGVLGSQIVSAVSTLRMKRLELSYLRRVDAYEDFMRKAVVFAHDPINEDKYIEYLRAFEVALIHSSDEVAKALSSKQGLNVAAQCLRPTLDVHERFRLQSTVWFSAMEWVINAMRDDLRRVSRS